MVLVDLVEVQRLLLLILSEVTFLQVLHRFLVLLLLLNLLLLLGLHNRQWSVLQQMTPQNEVQIPMRMILCRSQRT
jgi:hypothetical protein